MLLLMLAIIRGRQKNRIVSCDNFQTFPAWPAIVWQGQSNYPETVFCSTYTNRMCLFYTLQKLANLMELDQATLRQQLTCLKAKSYSLQWTGGADATQGVLMHFNSIRLNCHVFLWHWYRSLLTGWQRHKMPTTALCFFPSAEGSTQHCTPSQQFWAQDG